MKFRLFCRPKSIIVNANATQHENRICTTADARQKFRLREAYVIGAFEEESGRDFANRPDVEFLSALIGENAAAEAVSEPLATIAAKPFYWGGKGGMRATAS